MRIHALQTGRVQVKRAQLVGQADAIIGLAMRCKPPIDFCGYWLLATGYWLLARVVIGCGASRKAS